MIWNTANNFSCLFALLVACFPMATASAQKPELPPVQMSDPGQTGIRIESSGLIGNYYPVAHKGKRPAILIFGGSEGGLGSTVTRHAKALQKAGYTTFHFSWWRAPGQAQRIDQIPIESFEAALSWLKAQKGVDPKRIAVFGWSRGTEAAQLLAIRHPEIRAVVLGMPANAVWPGFDWDYTAPPPQFAWTFAGNPYPTVPTSALARKILQAWTEDDFDHYTRTLESAPAALIQIEKLKAPVLMICGEADGIWPSCPMGRKLKERAAAAGKTDIELLAYADVGHMAYGAPVSSEDVELAQQLKFGGGDLAKNQAALSDGFSKTLIFLKSAFRK